MPLTPQTPRITEIRNATASMASSIANAFIDFSKMTASVVALVTDVMRDGRPVIGYGFNSNGRYAARGLLEERFIPRLRAAEPDAYGDGSGNLDPHRAWDILFAGEKPGGHGERSVAIGVLDMALWDATAKIAGVPLWRLLADRYRGGRVDARVWVYAAGGYYDRDKGIPGLVEEMRSYLDRGYDTVKIKIGGAPLNDDLARIEAVLELLGGDGTRLCVDANGRFDRATALAYADALSPFGLRWYEEAGDPLDFEIQAALAEVYAPPLATGENLFSMQDARNLARYGGMRAGHDVFQFDCALSYGLVEYLRTLEMLRAQGFSARDVVPHGGHQMSLNIAAGLGLGGNESYPDVFAPFGGFADDTAVEDGYVALHTTPGIGFEAKAALIAEMRRVTET
ncbi:MAG: mandelate racemase/muconate lactonizing enzyme family protein [Pseudomonadota bacterium]